MPQLRPLRLRALREHPEAFGVSVAEEEADDLRRLIGVYPSLTLGVLVEDALVATAGYMVSARMKQRHKAHLGAVYVAPEWRGTALASDLLGALISQARATGLRMLTLSVTVGNVRARRLYRRLGFVSYGTEPASLLVDGVLWDEELMALTLSPGAAMPTSWPAE